MMLAVSSESIVIAVISPSMGLFYSGCKQVICLQSPSPSGETGMGEVNLEHLSEDGSGVETGPGFSAEWLTVDRSRYFRALHPSLFPFPNLFQS